MTRTLFRSMLVALCLTTVTVGSARSDSWFSGWGKKKAEAASEDAPSPGTGLISDESSGENSDAIVDEEPSDEDGRLHFIDKVNMKHAEHQVRRAARKDNRLQRRDARLNARGIYDYTNRPLAPCYPQLNSSLYPCPRPDIPSEVGSTLITNQAFYPHEMLYAHQYRALYPPFYYENKCGITCIPFIPKPCIAGTVVTVKYKTCLPCGFHPPVTLCGGLEYPWSAAGIPTFHR